MAVTEAQRFDLQASLRKVLGTDVANTLMEHLPPSGWGDVVRTTDLHNVRTELRAEIASLRSEVSVLGSDIRREMAERFEAQTKWLVGLTLTSGVGMIGTLVAVFLVVFTR